MCHSLTDPPALKAAGSQATVLGMPGPERLLSCAVLGFEDCSAKTEAVTSAKLSLAQPWSKEHEALGPKAWAFYSFDVTPDDYQIVANVAAELDTTCEALPNAACLQYSALQCGMCPVLSRNAWISALIGVWIWQRLLKQDTASSRPQQLAL